MVVKAIRRQDFFFANTDFLGRRERFRVCVRKGGQFSPGRCIQLRVLLLGDDRVRVGFRSAFYQRSIYDLSLRGREINKRQSTEQVEGQIEKQTTTENQKKTRKEDRQNGRKRKPNQEKYTHIHQTKQRPSGFGPRRRKAHVYWPHTPDIYHTNHIGLIHSVVKRIRAEGESMGSAATTSQRFFVSLK